MVDYGVQALADSLVRARQWRNAVPELRDYHATKRAALVRALGADEARLRRSSLDALLDSTVERLTRSANPFEDYLEAPEPVIALHHRHGRDIDRAATALHTALMALLVELVVEGYGIPRDRAVTGEELRRHGFDPRSPEPDPLDFW